MQNSGDVNPLLHIHFRIPFDQIRAEHVEPAIADLLSDSSANIESLAADSTPRTFDNTILALEAAPERLDYAMSVVRHLEAVDTYPALRQAFNNVQPEVSAFYSSIPLHAGIWKQIKQLASTGEVATQRRAQATSNQRRSIPSAGMAPSSATRFSLSRKVPPPKRCSFLPPGLRLRIGRRAHLSERSRRRAAHR